MSAELRVVVAEDSILMRTGVVGLLGGAGFDVVAEAGDAEELLDAVRRSRPDVAVVDIRMPPGFSDEGLQAALVIRAELPQVGVLILSQRVEEGVALQLLGDRPDGVGYLLKDRVLEPASFAEAVRQVARGGSVLDPEVVAEMLAGRSGEGPLARLSDRERDVLARMAEGQSNQAIAQALEIGERAVERHVSRIFSKLELASGFEAHRRVLAVLAYLRAADEGHTS
jgi:DNA-binding NarL/FixJ family response regulator